jgi:hypothetical protein
MDMYVMDIVLTWKEPWLCLLAKREGTGQSPI